MLIFDELDLSGNATSIVIDCTQKTEKPNGIGLFFQWYGVTGTLDGEFEVFAYYPNDTDVLKPFKAGFTDNKVVVDSADNTANCKLLIIPYPIQKIQIKYTKNNISAGTASVLLLKDNR